ncbi:MAG TPA: type IV secretory system conjugative DNA transfer family protein [Chloroflexota bacterium]|nr:type IV secretory system conjugative DNA transfer family protein [Chloroflexota bacterium]
MKRRLLLILGIALLLGGGYFLTQGTGPATVTARTARARRQTTALEQWVWVALAWPAEDLTRLNLSGSLSLSKPATHMQQADGQAPKTSSTPGFISWQAWLAVPSPTRWRMLHQPTAHAKLVQALVLLEVVVVPVLLGLLLYRPLVGRRLGRLRPSTVKGSARWLSRSEIRGLRPRAGQAPLVLGRAASGLVALPEAEAYQNTLVVGPPGSGKSASLFISTLLEEQGRRSLVIVDPKNELIERTYAAVGRRHDVAILNFLDPTVSIAYNPLSQVTDALSAHFFADAWVRNTGTSTEDFWNDTAKQLIAAAALHLNTVLAQEGGATLNDLALFLTGQEPEAIVQAFHDSPSAEARRMGEHFLKSMQQNPRLLGSIFTGLPLRFQIIADWRVQAVTGSNELDFARLVDPLSRPLALYVALDHTMAHLLTPLSACFFTQLFTSLMGIAYRQPSKELPRPVLCLIDEFGNVGAIPQMQRWLSTIRGARMGCVLAVQDLAQVSATYGRDHRQVIVTACTTRVGLAGMVANDAQWFSEQTGVATVVTRSAGTSRKRGEALAQSGNEGVSESSQPLLTPGEVTRMGKDQLLVLAGNRQPVLLRQRRWYQDRRLKRLGNARLPNGEPIPPGGPKRSKALAAPTQMEEAGAVEQAWWQEQAAAAGVRPGARDEEEATEQPRARGQVVTVTHVAEEDVAPVPATGTDRRTSRRSSTQVQQPDQDD